MKLRFLALGFGFAWIAAGCGTVSTTGGTGGSGAEGGGGQAGGTPTPGPGGHAGGTGGTGENPGGAGGAGGGGPGGEGGVSGGHGGGTSGSTGTGGHAGTAGGGHGGQTCDDIAAAFQAALPEAESCMPGATHQCEKLASTSPLGGCPGCGQYVNDDTMLNALRTQYTQQGCQRSNIFCPQFLCIQPQKQGCMPSDASAGGTCRPIVSTGSN